MCAIIRSSCNESVLQGSVSLMGWEAPKSSFSAISLHPLRKIKNSENQNDRTAALEFLCDCLIFSVIA